MFIGCVVLIDTGIVSGGERNVAAYSRLLTTRGVSLVIGLGLMAFFYYAPIKWLKALTPLITAIALLSLLLVLFFGVEVRGTKAWFDLGPLGKFQPIEFAKLAIVLYLARFLDGQGLLRKAPLRRSWWPVFVTLLFLGLILAENEISGAAFIALLAIVMAELASLNNVQRLWVAGPALAGLFVVLALKPEKLERFLPPFRPFADLDGYGYQSAMSVWAIVRGGFLGTGPGNSVAMYVLPDHTTDFIFSITCEEYGVIGGLLVLGLLVIFVRTAFTIALRQEDRFCFLAGCGIAASIGLQAAVNIGVATNFFPITGLPLPFVSAGNSSLTMTMAMLGILLGLTRTMGASVTQSRTLDSRETAYRAASGRMLTVRRKPGPGSRRPGDPRSKEQPGNATTSEDRIFRERRRMAR